MFKEKLNVLSIPQLVVVGYRKDAWCTSSFIEMLRRTIIRKQVSFQTSVKSALCGDCLNLLSVEIARGRNLLSVEIARGRNLLSVEIAHGRNLLSVEIAHGRAFQSLGA